MNTPISPITSSLFAVTTLLSLFLFYRTMLASNSENTRAAAPKIALTMAAWLVLHAVLTLTNFYNTRLGALPPRIVLFGIVPLFVTIGWVLLSMRGRQFADSLPLENLTKLSIVRVPVEVVLWLLFSEKLVPQIMTFEGRNFDILAGLTAPLVAWLIFSKKIYGRHALLFWNFAGLALLLNIIAIAAFSLPTPLQRFGFEQPNLAIVNFSVSWLPTFVAPLVLFTHLISIRLLLKKS